MLSMNANSNNGLPSILPKNLGDTLYFNSDEGYEYLLVNLGLKKKTELLDENGFTPEQSALYMKRYKNPDRSKDVVFTPEEWDAYGRENGLI